MARDHSIYETTCLCGALVQSKTKDMKCAKCGLEIHAEWPHHAGGVTAPKS
jgi:hypothetical protein